MLSALLSLWSVQRALRMTPDAAADLQARKLRKALRYAYERVPLYRKRFDKAGVRPDDLRSVSDLPGFPQTAKEDLQTSDTGRILAAGVDAQTCRTRLTSGSTGKPLRIYLSEADLQMRSLVEWRSMMQLGVRHDDYAVAVGPETQRRPRLHERLGFFANERVSGSLPPEEQLRKLGESQPTVLWVYPTILRALLRAADYRLREHVRPRMLVTSAEMCDDLLREQTRADLGLDPYSAYGTNEAGRIAIECPAREGLHINIDHVVLEAWTDSGPAKPGETGSALITTLNASAMPLIRYRLGDRIRLLDKPCSCGSPLPLMDLPQGREGDVILLPSGRLISTWPVAFALREYLDIVQFRILQEQEDCLRVEIVLREPWDEARIREVRKRLLERLGEPMTIDVRIVEDLQPDDLKFRHFISRLTPEARALRQ